MARCPRRPSTHTRELVRKLRRVFQETHQFGRRALLQNDLKTFGEAIAVERSLIDELSAIIKQQRDAIRRRRGSRGKTTPRSKIVQTLCRAERLLLPGCSRMPGPLSVGDVLDRPFRDAKMLLLEG